MATIVALTNGSPHSWIILNAVVERFGPLTVLQESKEGRLALMRRRMKRLGPLTVAGQVGFLFLYRLIARFSRARVAEILASQKLDPRPNASCQVYAIPSVNDPRCRELLAELRPDVVVVFGTRIIGKDTLKAVQVPVMNLHSGITPLYRGQAGGYWALALGDQDHAGVTVHLVDHGVDTGEVLYQASFQSGPRDNVATYFYLQAAAFRAITVQAIEDALEGRLRPYRLDQPSRLYYHPTVWSYLRTGFQMGVW